MWSRLASELERAGAGFLALAVLDADVSFEGEDAMRVKIGSSSAMRILTDNANREKLNRTFAALSKRRLIIEQVQKLDDDQAVPYLVSMFGKSLEIK